MVNGDTIRLCPFLPIFEVWGVSVGVTRRDELSDERKTWTAVEKPISPDKFVMVIPNFG